ncbi:DMP19 family protein [Flavobacterium olei]|uniref:DMP19 family protein n=1 Tax=Flavobacterium olei TaxID=1886782 RepID=UPI00321AFF70
MKIDKIIVSKNSFESSDVYYIISSNISVTNLLLQEDVDENDINEDALASYYVDYYTAQYKNGNFSQFVWNSKWNESLNEIIIKGLEKMGAHKNLELFKEQSLKVYELGEEKLNAFLERDYFGPNPTREQLRNSSFYSLDEDIVQLNAEWLRNHPKLQPLSEEDMYTELEKITGKKIARE